MSEFTRAWGGSTTVSCACEALRLHAFRHDNTTYLFGSLSTVLQGRPSLVPCSDAGMQLAAAMVAAAWAPDHLLPTHTPSSRMPSLGVTRATVEIDTFSFSFSDAD